MSATQTLKEVLSQIRPKKIGSEEKVAMNKFRQEVCQFIQQRFPLHHERVGEPRHMGSKEKGTDIAQHYDLDIVVPFCHGHKKGARGTKAALFHALKEHFHSGSTAVRDQRVSVGLRRKFGNFSLAIDIVPGVEKSPGSYNDKSTDEKDKFLVLYDRESNCERTTNINRQVRLVREKMQYYRDVVRLLKVWRYKHKHPISSYALELLVFQAATAKGAPKTGSELELLVHVLQFDIAFLRGNGSLQDIGAGYTWPDFLKPNAKVQLAGLWKKLLRQLQEENSVAIRASFL